MLGWLRGLFSRPRPSGVPVDRFNELRAKYQAMKARYDAAQTTNENKNHWSNADGLSAAAANHHGVRFTLRNRSRYEYDNGGYCNGIVRTRADDMVGTGPTLQFLEGDEAVTAQTEKAWRTWARACCLGEKLHTMDQARNRDGESFAILTTNRRLNHPVKLDLRVIECDQVTHPGAGLFAADIFPLTPTEEGNRILDGIEYDSNLNPISYTVLKEHPGDRLIFGMGPFAFDQIAARYMLHWFRKDRPDQLRGVPELTSSLPLFAYLRRWTLATLNAAETAALFAAVLKSTAPADTETVEPNPFSTLEIERGMMTELPDGKEMQQFKAEHPNTLYADFKREILSEIGRPVRMPINVVTADSSRHNFSSAKLDHFGYRGGIWVDRSFAEINILDKIFAAFVEEASRIPGVLPEGVDVLAMERQWNWPGWASMDKDEAKNVTERLNNGTTTLSEEAAADGVDWRARIRQRGKELKLGEQEGVPPPPTKQAGPPPGGDGAPVGAGADLELHLNGRNGRAH